MPVEIPMDRAAEIAVLVQHLLQLLAADYSTGTWPTAAPPTSAAKPPARLTIEQFCKELDIAPSTFHDWRAKGKAPKCIRLPNGRIVIRRAEFERWLEALEVA